MKYVAEIELDTSVGESGASVIVDVLFGLSDAVRPLSERDDNAITKIGRIRLTPANSISTPATSQPNRSDSGIEE